MTLWMDTIITFILQIKLKVLAHRARRVRGRTQSPGMLVQSPFLYPLDSTAPIWFTTVWHTVTAQKCMAKEWMLSRGTQG